MGLDKVKGLDWGNQWMILTSLGRRIGSKELNFSWNLSKMIQMKALTKRNLGRKIVFELGLAISWNSTVGLSSKLEDLSRRPQCSS